MSLLPATRQALARNYTAISLFSGIGGMDIAFSAAGFTILAQVEIDEFCRRVLEKHRASYWPQAKIYEDVHEVGAHNLPANVDCIFGGFPCQDISLSGQRAGIGRGTRSGLWWQFTRIIGELRPRIVCLENVPGIYTLGGTDVVGSLTEMGYDTIWLPLPASGVGAPHRRERWFCVAYCNSKRHVGQINRKWRYHSHKKRNVSQAQSKRKHKQSGVVAQYQTLGNAAQIRRQRRGASRAGIARPSYTSQRQTQPGLGRDAHGLPAWLDRPQWPARPGEQQHDYEPPRTHDGGENRVNRIQALGNAVVPQVVYPLALAIKQTLEEQTA